MQKKQWTKKTLAARAAMYGVLVALAMIFSYIEMLIPITIGIPGVKPGLANLVVFAALYLMTPADAFVISMVRILLVGMTFGNMFALLYSFAGGILSFLVMWLCMQKNWMGKTGVSIAGGISHNIGQLIVAAVVLESAAVFAYLPVLLLSGTVMGALIGFLGACVIKRLPRQIW
ncbi:MAG: Gx transporter family protein [Eubacteriales bacterium]|nr:Gx transporter family protein [Eubacteriales bacterium]